MQARTTESFREAGKLYGAATGMPQDKAAIAAMMAEAFINGMNMQKRLTAGNEPQQPQA